MRTSVVWFRRDLRLHDHPALTAAQPDGDRIAPLFVIDERLLAGRFRSANRLWFMRGSVSALATALEVRGAPLSVVRDDVLPATDTIRGVGRVDGRSIEDLLETVTPSANLARLPVPGEGAARERLARWTGSQALGRYATDRDRLDLDGTSRLGQDLRWGLLAPSEVAARCVEPGEGRRRFLSDLAWRDFYAHFLWHEPRAARASLRPSLERVAWEQDPRVDAWRTGRTGFPVVDAAMRQLTTSGWMHNRARMIAGSFLTKHLGVDWRVGGAALHGAPHRRRSGQQQRRLAMGGVDGDGPTTVVPDLQPDAPGDRPRSRGRVRASLAARARGAGGRGGLRTAARSLRHPDRRPPRGTRAGAHRIPRRRRGSA